MLASNNQVSTFTTFRSKSTCRNRLFTAKYELAIRNEINGYSLAIDVIDCVPRPKCWRCFDPVFNSVHFTSIVSVVAKFFFDSQKLIVFGDAIGTRK